jgi:hypothetical protein
MGRVSLYQRGLYGQVPCAVMIEASEGRGAITTAASALDQVSWPALMSNALRGRQAKDRPKAVPVSWL